ncbi:SigmaW regulon antibacterial [Maioricimonas rarisocia]|uniref:SigmaW regulon antibacterial n=1 Tax=Maioricimonas rarisocia TaxID=2528026 RepID=A0A517ZDD4_9PLAN|nr:flotillin-like FloA family protein [Maioricimonas rarisocia]QDU40472.1 SigmaW regulon antibacterial [Maioricimonas rarisocia]
MIPTWVYVAAAIVALVLMLVISRYFGLWLRAYVTGTRIGIFSLMMMSLRNVSPRVIVDCQVMAVQAGLAPIPTRSFETQYLAGGDVQRVTLALVVAHRALIELDWDTAAAIDLAGRDILTAVQLSVNPRVIYCPDPEIGRSDTLDGVAQDGIQLRVRVRVTVRTNIAQLVGGATEATVIARVGQGIVSSIGECATYREALADPLIISRKVLGMGLDSQTAFSIVSIDIADIDVGENIGAKLRIEQADADIRIALSHAEKRRAMAIAREQEMIALTRQREAEVVLAEAQIPLAIAGAFEAGDQLRTEARVDFAFDQESRFPRMLTPPATAG